MNFDIITRDTAGPIPLVVHVPHSSVIIPPAIRQTLCLSDHELQRELLCMTDWYTDRLLDPVLELGGTLFVNRVSRLVVDPERFPDDSQEVMATKGMGAVYTHTADGRALRHRVSPEERSRLLDTYFHPYAQAFAELVSQMLDRHGRCVILDGHSFPSVPLPYELDQRSERLDICLGTDDLSHWCVAYETSVRDKAFVSSKTGHSQAPMCPCSAGAQIHACIP
jgi:N-formylglutamate amidohydrolase